MKFKKIYKYCYFITLFFCNIPLSYSLTLNEAIDILYKNNDQLKSQQLLLKQYKIGSVGAGLSLLPDIRYDKKLYGKTEFNVDATLIPSRSGDSDTSGHTLTIQETFTTSKLVGNTAYAKKILDIRKYNLRSNEQKILLEAIQGYLSVIKGIESDKAAKENFNVISKYKDLVQKKFDLGEATRTDLEQSIARMATAKASMIQNAASLEIAKATFEKIFKISPENLNMPSALPLVPKTYDDFKKIGINENISYKIAKLSTQAATAKILIETEKTLPFVTFSYQDQTSEAMNSITSYHIDQKSYNVGLTVPILPNGGAEFARIAQAKVAQNQSMADYYYAQKQLEEEISRNWQILQSSDAQMESTKIATNASKRAMEAVEREVAYGSRTVLDFLNAQLEYFNNYVSYINAQYNQQISYYQLLTTINQLKHEIFQEKNIQIKDSKAKSKHSKKSNSVIKA